MQPAGVKVIGVLVRSSLMLVLHVLGWLFVKQLIWPAGELTLIWPPAAVSFAGLLLFGLRYWPVVALACTVVELQQPGTQLIGAFLSICGPTLGAVAGAWLCRRLADGRELTGLSVRDLWLLLLGAVLLGAVSGLFGTLSAVWFPTGAPVQALRYWLAWLLGDLLGIVVCTPALLALHHAVMQRRLSPLDRTYCRPVERWAWLLVTGLSLWVLLSYGVHAAAPVQGLAFLPLALLAWSALRLEPLFTSVPVAVLGLSFAALSSLGIGGFETPHSIGDSAIVALFLATLAALPHLLSAAEYGRRQLLAELADQAHRDDLTGLLNRRGFQARLKQLLKQNQARGEHIALVHLDLDQFKLINDACGAEAGDAFLAQIGSVQAAHMRNGDLLARIGGDEFAQLWRNTDQAAADRRADELLQLVEAFRFPSRGRVLSLTGSIGLVCVALQGQSSSQLEREATTAAQTAKEQGGNRVKRVIGVDLEVRRRQDDMQWAVMLSEALEQNRFRLFAQRIVPLAGHAEGLLLEVLVRMDDGTGHLLAPGRFIPAAERYGLAARLDRHVLR
ncbi:MAG: diguanylate cyclase, partial [Xanthomonadales bacterium]|nr:diguanylate cyclase [Xanthomonadales bacterium]